MKSLLDRSYIDDCNEWLCFNKFLRHDQYDIAKYLIKRVGLKIWKKRAHRSISYYITNPKYCLPQLIISKEQYIALGGK